MLAQIVFQTKGAGLLGGGACAFGISLTGNPVGLSETDLAALPEVERNQLNDAAAKKLRDAGADHVIDSVADLPDLIKTLRVNF